MACYSCLLGGSLVFRLAVTQLLIAGSRVVTCVFRRPVVGLTGQEK